MAFNSSISTCRYGVVFALSIESGWLEDLLQCATTTRGHGFRVRCGELAGRQVAIVQSGPGRERAARAAHALIDGHRPGVVISAGFAGALDATLRRGDIVAADCLVDETGRELTADRTLLSAAEARGARVGRLLTVDRVIRASEEKLALGRKHAALAADMETLAVAEVCGDRQQPFLALRVINDAADDALPRDVERLLAQETGARRLGTAVGLIFKRPSTLVDLLRLQHRAIEASNRLAKFLAGLMRGEGESPPLLPGEGRGKGQ
jgi:adenosylhomocysteine nucleosidase